MVLLVAMLHMDSATPKFTLQLPSEQFHGDEAYQRVDANAVYSRITKKS
jgi:hypothetical protein